MNFSLTDAQQEIARLAGQLLDDGKTDPWKELARSGLLAPHRTKSSVRSSRRTPSSSGPAPRSANCGSSARSATAVAPPARPCSRPRWPSPPGRRRSWSATTSSTSGPAIVSAGWQPDRRGHRQRVAPSDGRLATRAAMVAMIARRYLHVSGATTEEFGLATVADRRHAGSNPKAWFFAPPAGLLAGERRRGGALRPLHLLRAHPAGRARLLRPRRGPRVHLQGHNRDARPPAPH